MPLCSHVVEKSTVKKESFGLQTPPACSFSCPCTEANSLTAPLSWPVKRSSNRFGLIEHVVAVSTRRRPDPSMGGQMTIRIVRISEKLGNVSAHGYAVSLQ